MELVWFVGPFLEMFSSMDWFDLPKACPIVGSRPLSYSIGYYTKRRRKVIAWFADYDAALDYLRRTRSAYPRLKIDMLNTLF